MDYMDYLSSFTKTFMKYASQRPENICQLCLLEEQYAGKNKTCIESRGVTLTKTR